MKRYDFLLDKKESIPSFYRFNSTNSVATILKYMRTCLRNKLGLDGTNLNMELLESALMLLSKEKGIPVIVNLATTAKILSITYNCPVYSKDNIPNNINEVFYHPEINTEIPEIKCLFKIKVDKIFS